MATAFDEQVAKAIIWVLYFVGLYFSLFWLVVLLNFNTPNSKRSLKRGKEPQVTIIMPAWNEEKYLEPTLKSLLKLDYPKDRIKFIVVNDGSTDRTYEIAKKLQKKYGFRLLTQKNQGKFVALNHGLKYVKTPYFACLDVDGYVDKYALKHILEEFTDENVAAVVPVLKVTKPKTLLDKVQYLEYILNIFLKYLFGKLNCIHVTPGPLGTYRTEVVRKLGGFKRAHMTEDLEIAFRLQNNNYVIKQSLDAVIYTNCPSDLKGFISQRTRWYHGTILNIIDYRHFLFNKKYGEFGFFYMPLVTVTGFLSFLGVFTILYLFFKEVYLMIRRGFLTGFDFVTYFSSYRFVFNPLYFDYQTVFTSTVLFVVVFLFIYLSFRATKEDISFGKTLRQSLMFLYYFFVYKFLLAHIWLKVFYRLVFKKSNKWDKVN